MPSVDEIRGGLFSDDPSVKFAATQAARKILSRAPIDTRLIDTLVEAGIVPR